MSTGPIITSNRDENTAREVAIPPKSYEHGPYTLTYPKDTVKGGTWIAVRSDGWVAILLNGANRPFQNLPTHTKSRGLIILEILQQSEIPIAFSSASLNRMAPFTMVLCDKDQLLEARWDGKTKTLRPLHTNKAHIWSSATLYDHGTIRRKEFDFHRFLDTTNHTPSHLEVLNFHKGRYSRNTGDFLFNDKMGIRTLSITQIHQYDKLDSMDYHNLENEHSMSINPLMENFERP